MLDIAYADVDRIAKLIPPALDMTLEKALAENPVLREMRDKDPRVKDVLEMGKRLEGMSRHAGVHAAGVVIAPGRSPTTCRSTRATATKSRPSRR